MLGVAAASLILISAAWGQATSPVHPAGQIGPGTAGSISPAQGVTGAGAGGATKKMLDNALTPQTRQTLQDAMNSVGPDAAGAITVGPGEAAQLDGAGATKVDFDTLPDSVKNALGAAAHDALRSGATR